MNDLYGYIGKILRVNLTDRSTSTLDTMPLAARFIGGRGIAAYLYWREVPREVKAFDPENRLILMTGPLDGIMPGSNRVTVAGKAPGSYPEEVYCTSNCGGHWATALKRAGFDGIVIRGKAERPVYLWIEDGKVEILDAKDIWGSGTRTAQAILMNRHGDDASAFVIGPAGENLCRNSVIIHETGHAFGGTVGFGALMGSKKLKAILARGTGSLKVARPKELLDVWYQFSREVSRREDEPEVKPLARRPEFPKPGSQYQVMKREKLGQVRITHSSCHNCPIGCYQTFSYKDDTVPAIASSCHTYQSYRDLEAQYYGKDHQMGNVTVYSAVLFNDLGVDSYVPAGLCDMIIWMKDKGLLTSENSSLDLESIGSKEFITDLLHKIAYRQGIGDKLAEGNYRFLEYWGGEEAAAISRQMRCRKGNVCTTMGGKCYAYIGGKPTYVAGSKAHMIMNLTDTRGYINYGYVWNGPQLLGWVDVEPGTPEYTELKNRAALKWFGSELAMDESTWEKKLDVALFHQRFVMIESSSTYCEWIFPRFYSNYSDDKMGTLDLPARFWSAITGIDVTYDELHKKAETLQTLERAILVREGRNREHDWFHDDFFEDNNWTEKDKDDLRKVMDEYYDRVGWDQKTGWPTRERLEALNLKDVADDLEAMGKLP